MSERLARLVSYPLVLAGLCGLVLRIKWAGRRGVPHAGDRWALLLAVAPVVILSFIWAAKTLRAGSRALLMWWAMRIEARREARRTILLNLPVPVLAKVDENSCRLTEAEAELRAQRRILAGLAESMDEACRAAGVRRPDSEETAPIPGGPLRLAWDADRDSA